MPLFSRFKRVEGPRRAVWNGHVLAEADATVKVEGNEYFPPDSIRWELFSESSRTSVCPWKGTAGYYDIVADGERVEAAAWTYADPLPAASDIAGHLAFSGGVRVETG